MAVTLTATLLSASDPRPVRIALNGTAIGQAYEIVGTTADGGVWPVPGGRGISAGSQVIVDDNRSALNTLITYSAVVDGATYTAAPVIVVGPVAVLQTIDGQIVVPIDIASVTEPRSVETRTALYEVAGRPDPATRLDVPSSDSYTWELETENGDSATMRQLLATGLPVVRRLSPGLRDFDAVVLGVVTAKKDELFTEGADTWRRWSLTVREIRDPQPSTALVAFNWDDFDSAMADRVWSWHTLFPSTTGWAATNGTITNSATGGYQTSRFLRASATTAASIVDVYETAYTGAAATLGEPVVAGMVVTITLRLKGTAGRSAMATLKWSNGTVVPGSAVTLTGEWQLVTVTATAPAGVNGVSAGARMAATGVVVGSLLELSAPTISKGATVPVGTFDELFATWDEFDAADWPTL